jgi:CheY-like chemotaxis protein
VTSTPPAPPPEPPYTVLVIDDDEDFLSDAVEFLEGPSSAEATTLRVVPSPAFESATPMLEDGVVDVLVLDVRDASEGPVDEHHGVRVFNDIRALKFLPVIFHTGMPQTVERLAQPPLVQVVPKTEGVEGLAAAIQRAFDSGLPALARGLSRHVRDVTRDYLWNDVADQWAQLQDYGALDVAYQLTSRLARSLADADAAPLVIGMRTGQGSDGALAYPDGWHAAKMYEVPAGDPQARAETGELVEDPDGAWWFVLTPACDITNNKADWIQLVACVPLDQIPVVKALISAKSGSDKDHRGKVAQLLSGATPRYFHLPPYLTLPDLVLDLQQVTAVQKDDMQRFSRRAALTPPYAQSIVSRYAAYMSRIGLPNPPAREFVDAIAARRDQAPR